MCFTKILKWCMPNCFCTYNDDITIKNNVKILKKIPNYYNVHSTQLSHPIAIPNSFKPYSESLPINKFLYYDENNNNIYS